MQKTNDRKNKFAVCSAVPLPSKLNMTLDVPITPATERLVMPDMPVPRMPMQVTEVCVIQLLVEQSAVARAAVAVASVDAKFAPLSVTLVVMVAML